jgi:AcrR family transcriptional regulator
MARKTLGVRKNPKEEQRRTEIRQAAITVFASKGYHNATMNDIEMETGCSKSLIYWYWESKSALFSELMEEGFETSFVLIRSALKSRAPYMKKLNQLFWDLARFYGDNEELIRLLHYGGVHRSKDEKEDFHTIMRPFFETALGLFEQLFQQGIDSGCLRADLDAHALAFQLVSSWQGYLYMSQLKDWMPIERGFVGLWLDHVLPSMAVRKDKAR